MTAEVVVLPGGPRGPEVVVPLSMLTEESGRPEDVDCILVVPGGPENMEIMIPPGLFGD